MLWSYKNLFSFSFFNAVAWMISLGTPMVLLATELGASSFQVGIAYSFVFLLLPVQILATRTLPYFGYKKQAVFAWSLRACFLVIPIWLAYQAPVNPQPWMVYLIVFQTFAYAFSRSLGSCALMPWYYSILPDNIRGRFFSTDQIMTGTAGILTLLGCAYAFSVMQRYDAFLSQYIFCAVASFFAVVFLSRIPSVPKPADTSLGAIIKKTPHLILDKSPFRQFLFFMGVNSAFGAAYVPFTTYYLQVEANIPLERIMLFAVCQNLGAILSALILRSRLDRMGVKPVMRYSLIASMMIMSFWLITVSGVADLRTFLPFVYLLFGSAVSSWISCSMKYLPRICSEKDQALDISVHSSVVGIVAGLSPILWGLIVKGDSSSPSINTVALSIYFSLTLCMLLGLFLYVPQLTSENRERPAIQTGAFLIRPFRYLAFLPFIKVTKAEPKDGED